MKMDLIRDCLIEDIGIARYEHSVRVMETAMNLAKNYSEDLEKAKIAGLLHDCGKFTDKELLLKKAKDFGIIQDIGEADNIQLIHGRLGRFIAKEKYNIHDISILDGIEYHTTGRKSMTQLDKIIYMADYIEPKRNFDGVKEVREITFRDLDLGLLMALNKTIKLIVDIGQPLDINTVYARNEVLRHIKNREVN